MVVTVFNKTLSFVASVGKPNSLPRLTKAVCSILMIVFGQGPAI